MEGQIGELLRQFFADPLVRAVIGLVACDVIAGIGAAIYRNEFQWSKIFQFYRTNVVPYIFVYAGIYVAVELAVPGLGGEYSDVISQRVLEGIWTVIVYNLVMSIRATLETVGIIVDIRRVFRR